MKASNFCLLFIVSALLITLKTAQAQKPVIGIVSFYSEGWGYPTSQWNYIAASYVKWLKQAGAQVVPIQWDQPYSEIDYLLDRINGVVFTGGNINVYNADGSPAPIYLAFKHITEYVLKKNQNSHYYPLWGTCMGFWNIARILGQNMKIMTTCKDCIYVKRNVIPEASYSSRMLRNLPSDLKANIQKDKLNVFLHINMLVPSVFQRKTLSQYWTPVAYSYDGAGKKYVSMAESPKYPIYGTQFHPEKPEFENKAKYNIPHTADAIRYGRYLANFFVAEARKNRNTFSNSKNYLIDNYTPKTLASGEYESAYFFPRYGTSKRMLKGAL